MQRLIAKSELENHDWYPEETDRIIEACKNLQFEIDRANAVTAWEDFSGSWDASWMTTEEQSDQWIVGHLLPFCNYETISI